MNSSHQPVLPIAADTDALRRAMRRAEVPHDARVLVTGPAGLAALLWLYRHDFPGALYVDATRTAATTTVGDALVIPHACPTQELAAILGNGRCVREGGALIVQAPAVNPDPLRSAPDVLKAAGFEVQAHLPGQGHIVYVAKRMGAGGVTRAA